jgi:hypothetical protein
MKTNGKHEVVTRIARQSLAFAALLAMVLSIAAISGAQEGATSSAASVAKTAAAPAKASTSPAAKPAKGQHEGITVHGHWVIEVRNPDGKLVTHREFENALDPQMGAPLLAAILGRVVTPGSWYVTLADTASITNQIVINEPGSTAYAFCTGPLTAQYAVNGGAISCSNGLSVAGPKNSSGTLIGNTLTLAGSGTVPQGFPADIGFVGTVNLACATSNSPTTCFTVPALSNFSFTDRSLDGVGGDPPQVPVVANQTVSATVTLSFGPSY